VTPFHHGIDAGAGPQSLCVSCNACETVCPVEIPLPSLILDVRSRVVEAKGLHWIKKLILGTMARPRLFNIAARLISLAQFPVTRGSNYIRARNFGILGKLPLPYLRPMVKLASWRSFPAFSSRPLRDRVKRQLARQEGRDAIHGVPTNPGLTVCYFAGCMTDRLYPEMGQAVIHVLQTCGVRVTFPRGQNCCGLPALNSGDRRDGAAMARQTIIMLEQALKDNQADCILSASTSCVATIVQDYIKLFEDLDQQGWLQRTRELANKVVDFTSFLDRMLANGIQLPIRQEDGRTEIVTTYHDSCQSCNCLGLRKEARHIIQDALGLQLREMPQSDVCCGFGGSTSIEHGDVAERLLHNKLRNAESTGATILVADNPGCLMHLRGGVDAQGKKMRVLHLAQLVAERLE